MKLTKLKATDFRSLKCLELTFDPLTVLIGENDAGKSSVLDLLDVVLNNRQPDDNDYYLNETGEISDQIEVILEFQLEADDSDAQHCAINDLLIVKYVYTRKDTGKVGYYQGYKPL
jgi:putative ATP-dependent endonuclease of the OLD family